MISRTRRGGSILALACLFSLLAPAAFAKDEGGYGVQLGIVVVLGVLFPLIGLGLLVGAFVSNIRQRQQLATRTSAAGRVVGFEKKRFTAGSAGVFCPVVECEAPAGLTRFVSSFGSRPAAYSVGEGVKVLYDPAEPQKAEIHSALSRWLGPVVMGGMGCGFLFLGTLFFGVGLLFLAM